MKNNKNKKPTVTIGIPAYNEEKNIRRLLNSLLLQKVDNFILKNIIVISDGSTDKTVAEVKKVKSNKIKTLDEKIRHGLNSTQNQMLENTNSDILVILNGDSLPIGNSFLVELIKPFYSSNKIGLVGARIKSLSSNTFVSKVLTNSCELKELIAQEINHGDNVYLCHGLARAFSRAFYKNLKWPYDCPEDSYSYFACLEKGFEFVYAKDAVINFSMSSNTRDHIRQSKRFSSGKKALERFFDGQTVKNRFHMPVFLLLRYLFIFLFKKPLLTAGYLSILLFIYFFVKNEEIDHSKFETSLSSKILTL